MHNLHIRARRSAIEIGLCHGVSTRTLAARYGLSAHAVGRHARAHLPPATAAAILMASKPEEIDLDALTEREGSNLLANLVHQRARLGQYAEKALVDGQTAVAVACERVIGQNLETCGKLLQRFIVRHEHSHSHLLMHPEYIRLRSTLVQTLRQFPDAAAAVARALHALDQDAVQAITEAKHAKHPPVAIEHQQQEASS